MKKIVSLLHTIYFRLGKIIVESVTVVKFGLNNRGSNGTGCFKIKLRTNTQV